MSGAQIVMDEQMELTMPFEPHLEDDHEMGIGVEACLDHEQSAFEGAERKSDDTIMTDVDTMSRSSLVDSVLREPDADVKGHVVRPYENKEGVIASVIDNTIYTTPFTDDKHMSADMHVGSSGQDSLSRHAFEAVSPRAEKADFPLGQVPASSCSDAVGLDVDERRVQDQDAPETEPGSRPPSPPPFISPRSLGIAPGAQYDFEWGRHSPLARAVIMRNWNSPIDSDSDPDEIY